jgi:hypothetical protein
MMLRIVFIALLLVNAVLLGLQAIDRSPLGAPGPAQDPTDQTEVPGLVLLSEMAGLDDEPAGSAECFALGPYQNEDERNLARRLMSGSAIAISQRQTFATIQRGMWVYLPVQPDYVTARSMALTLRDAGFAEARVVRDGEWNNSVSLGYFLDEANAAQVHREVRSLGFPVEMRPQENVEPRYWIDYEQRAGAPYVVPTPDGPITPELLRLIPCGDPL